MPTHPSRPRASTPPARFARALSAAFYLALIASVAWLAATRWHGVPGGSTDRDAIGVDRTWDATDALAEALAGVGSFPTLVYPPAPEGMTWTTGHRSTIGVREALYEVWNPRANPVQFTAIQHVRSAEVTNALDKLETALAGDWEASRPSTRTSGIRSGPLWATMLLASRARCRQAEQSDVDGALDDLDLAYRLTAVESVSPSLGHGLVTGMGQDLIHRELRLLAREHALMAGQGERILVSLARATRDRHSAWQRTIDATAGSQERTIERFYTNDGEGDGWLILARLKNILYRVPNPTPRSGAWNMLSIVFNDRRVMWDKVAGIRRQCEAVSDLAFGSAQRALQESSASHFNIFDGPLWNRAVFSSDMRDLHLLVYYAASTRNATKACVALSVFRQLHGEYPESLGELVPALLEATPVDPFDDLPLRYERKTLNEYVLYSIGPNCIDDNGIPATRGQTGLFDWDGDVQYSRPRGKLRSKAPHLVEVEP